VQGRVERTVLHLQEVVCGALDMLADLVTVCGSVEKSSENEHIKRALEQVCARVFASHGRRSTLDE
jgi:hypothetical protein